MRNGDCAKLLNGPISHLEEPKFRSIPIRSSQLEPVFSDIGKYQRVKFSIFENFAREEEPQDVILRATVATLDPSSLLESLERLDGLYARAGFNNEAKFGFLRRAVIKIPQVASFAMYRVAMDYEALKQAIRDFDKGTKIFGPFTPRIDPLEDVTSTEVRKEQISAEGDFWLEKLDAKIDVLINQVTDLTMLIKKSHMRSPEIEKDDRQ